MHLTNRPAPKDNVSHRAAKMAAKSNNVSLAGLAMYLAIKWYLIKSDKFFPHIAFIYLSNNFILPTSLRLSIKHLMQHVKVKD